MLKCFFMAAFIFTITLSTFAENTAENEKNIAPSETSITLIQPESLIIDSNWETISGMFNAGVGDFVTWLQVNHRGIIAFAIGAIVCLILVTIITLTFKYSIRWTFRKNENGLGLLMAKLLTKPLFVALYTIGLFASSAKILSGMPPNVREIVIRGFWGVFAFVILWGFFRCITVLDGVMRHVAQKVNSNINELLIVLVRKTLKVLVGTVTILFICKNIFDLDISTLLAGAGVVGLAVAFAAQNTVANFISSIMVIMDRPFAVGDRVKINNVDGCVEEVGLRSTKIRSLDGNLFALPNSMVADNAIENITRRPTLKYQFNITLTYSTTPEKMREAIKILHKILDGKKEFNMEDQPPLIHFGEFRDWSLAINVICWFNCDWVQFLQLRHNINLEILEKFNDAGLDFAFPTNTTYLAGSPKEPVCVSAK